jgi:hypothetical protein
VIGGGFRRDTAGRITQMMGQLVAQRALDQRFVAATDRRIELFGKDRPLPYKLVEDVGRNRRQRCRRAPESYGEVGA